MRTETPDYVIDCDDQRSSLSGVLRLHSPLAYEELFNGIATALDASAAGYTIDLQGVKFMNSSGITALSRLVLRARKLEKGLVFVGSRAIPWQQKTIASLQRLYGGLEVQFV